MSITPSEFSHRHKETNVETVSQSSPLNIAVAMPPVSSESRPIITRVVSHIRHELNLLVAPDRHNAGPACTAICVIVAFVAIGSFLLDAQSGLK